MFDLCHGDFIRQQHETSYLSCSPGTTNPSYFILQKDPSLLKLILFLVAIKMPYNDKGSVIFMTVEDGNSK